MTTIKEFFDSLRVGSIVRQIGWDSMRPHFIFAGWVILPPSGETAIAVVEMSSTRTCFIEVEISGRENTQENDGWESVDGTTVDIDVRRLAKRVVDSEVSLRKEGAAALSALEAVATYERDFKSINDALNDAAEELEWCDEYEDRISTLNEVLTFKLKGRLRNFTVPIRFSNLVSVPAVFLLTVEAHSSEEAREIVGKMTTREIMSELVNIGYTFKDLGFEVVQP